MARYVYVYPSISITEYQAEPRKMRILQSREQQIEQRASGGRRYTINDIAVEILRQLDGTQTYDGIIDSFVEKYREPHDVIDRRIQSFLNKLTSMYGFELRYQDAPEQHEITIKQFENAYPTVVSIELTDRCNLRCRHCYGSFGVENTGEIPRERLLPLFQSLQGAGVLTVELTGGDPSVYPYTADAIDVAFRSGIQSVMVLTNGVSLGEQLVDAIVRHRERLFVQIDLHSLDENHFDWFTNSKNALPKVMRNIDRLVEQGVQIRVCSIITPLNYREVVAIAEWSYEHGAMFYAPSPVVELGRAAGSAPNAGLMFAEQGSLEEFNDLCEVIRQRHPGFVRGKGSGEKLEKKACGALVSQCSIKASGDIKLCTMDTGRYFNLRMGNVLQQSMKQIFDSNREFLEGFARVTLPRIESEECRQCTYGPFCHGCLVRGFLRAQVMKQECRWYERVIPPIVKDRFPI